MKVKLKVSFRACFHLRTFFPLRGSQAQYMRQFLRTTQFLFIFAEYHKSVNTQIVIYYETLNHIYHWNPMFFIMF